MTEKLTAIVHGSGFAGTGHAEALRDAGVEVVGMVSRTPGVVKEVAANMGIPFAGTDWDAALSQLKPDIVALGMAVIIGSILGGPILLKRALTMPVLPEPGNGEI